MSGDSISILKKQLSLLFILILTCSTSCQLLLVAESESISPYSYQPPPLTNYGIKKVGQIDTGYGSMTDLCVSGNYAYIASRRGGLITFDVSDITSPTLVSVFDDEKEVSSTELWDSHTPVTDGIFVKDGLAYLADGMNGLVILNVSNPERPIKIGQYGKGTSIPNIFVSNNLAFVYGAESIKIIDVHNPRKLFLASKISFDPYAIGQTIEDFAVTEDYLFLQVSRNLIIYDISNPSSPIEINRLEEFCSTEITISENYAFRVSSEGYNTDRFFTLTILDIADPMAITFLGECVFETASMYIQSIVVGNSIVYIASYETLYAINASDVFNPHLSSTLALPSNSYSHKELALQTSATSLFDGIVFCADADEGLLIYNLSSPTNPVLVSRFDSGTQARDIYTDNLYAYLRHSRKFFSKSHIDILSLENPSSPSVVGSYYSNGTIRDIAIAEKLMFVAVQNEPTNRCLEIIDISQPSEPKLIGFYSSSISLYSLKIQVNSEGKFVVLAHDDQGFSIIDVSNISHPTLLYQGRPLGMNIVDIALDGTLLAIADGRRFGGFGIIDVSNPAVPRVLAMNGLNEAVLSITVKDSYLCLSTDYTPIRIYDISNPSTPQKLGGLYVDLWYPGYSITLNNSLAFLAREANGLVIIDIAKPAKPKSLLEYRPEYSGLSYDVTIFGKYILLADGWDGLEILELIPPEISREVFLTFTILPPVVGLGIVIFIAVQVIKKHKNPPRDS